MSVSDVVDAGHRRDAIRPQQRGHVHAASTTRSCTCAWQECVRGGRQVTTVKRVVIIAAAMVVLGEAMEPVAMVGTTVAIAGVLLYSILKQRLA